MDVNALRAVDLAALIDHTFLKPFGDSGPIERLCAEAREYGFAMVAIHPAEVVACRELLRGTAVRVGAAVGFPLGQSTSEVKAFETRDAIAKGAGEIDMVLNIRALQSGDTGLVRGEIAELARMCRQAGVISKVILETCYLTNEEKRIVCRLSREEGVDFVKTSTGFGSGGATEDDVRLMREEVGPKVGVKAAGGISDLDGALAMIRAGATRIGTSHGVKIMQEARTLLL